MQMAIHFANTDPKTGTSVPALPASAKRPEVDLSQVLLRAEFKGAISARRLRAPMK